MEDNVLLYNINLFIFNQYSCDIHFLTFIFNGGRGPTPRKITLWTGPRRPWSCLTS